MKKKMKTIKAVKGYTKEAYKQAICDACDDIKNRVDDILCDFDKHLQEVSITMKVGVGEISIINIEKIVAVEGEDIKEIPQFEGTLEQLDKLSIRGDKE